MRAVEEPDESELSCNLLQNTNEFEKKTNYLFAHHICKLI